MLTATPRPALDLSAFAGATIAVLGLGKSGLSAARALRQAGAELRAWDDAPARRDAAAAEGIPLVDLAQADWNDVTLLLLSPGIPHTHPAPHPVVARARAAGTEIVCDIELLARAERNAAYIGVTGTNGKSTTTALIGHILAHAGRRVAVGGNIGAPALTLSPMGHDGIYVLELSSYQLELLSAAAFDVAILLNLSPDHLDRHGGMAGYMAAKRRIFAGQPEDGMAVVGIDDADSKAVFEDLVRRGQSATAISVTEPVAGGVYVADGWLVDDRRGDARRLVDLRTIETLPGAHNAQNAAAAFAAVSALAAGDPSLSDDKLVGAMATFPGLAHRQELVAVVGDCRYINDSKATNAEAAARALACHDNILWIAGGRAKAGGISTLTPYFARVRHAFLIGEAANDFALTLAGHVSCTFSGDLATAVKDAAAMAAKQSRPTVVLLSPACASFDQFTDFEARGEAFRAAVAELPDVSLAPAEGAA